MTEPDEATRSAAAAAELAEFYRALRTRLGRASTGAPGLKVSASPSVHSIPLRLDVAGLVTEIEGWAVRAVPLCRGALRLGLGGIALEALAAPPERAVSRLRWLGGNLAAVFDADLGTARYVARDAWTLHRQAVRTLGHDDGPRAYRLHRPCPECGIPSLWVDPYEWIVACGNPGCFVLGQPRWWPVEMPDLYPGG